MAPPRRRIRRAGRWPGIVALVACLHGGQAAPTGAAEVREFERPVLTYPTAVAAAPDGRVWVASTYADKLVRFDPESGKSEEIGLPLRTHPAGLVVGPGGAVWYSASGLGVVGRVDWPARRRSEFAIPSLTVARYAIPSPWSLAVDARGGEVWFTIQSEGAVGRMSLRAEPVRGASAVRELKLGEPLSRPFGVAADGQGGIWVAELGADRLTRIDTADGSLRRLPLPPGSRPRGVAAAGDGTVWVTLFGSNRLLAVDPRSLGTREWPLPSGARARPAAVAVDGGGNVWVSEYGGNAVVRFDPSTGRFQSFPLPTPNSRVQAIATDARGRLWYAGSFSGRLGVIE